MAQFFLRFIVSSDVDPKVAKRYVDKSFLVKVTRPLFAPYAGTCGTPEARVLNAYGPRSCIRRSC